MNKRKYKSIIDKFINLRYEHLLDCSKNVLKGKSVNPMDLVAELVIFFYDNQDKLEHFITQESFLNYTDQQMLEGFSVSWLRIQGRFNSSTFWRKYIIKDREEGDIPDLPYEAEDLNEDEYVTDLRNVYTEAQIEKILKIHEIYPTLTKVEQMLFKAYFLENLSYEKIKDKYTFYRTDKNGKKIYYKSKKSIYNLMNDLKETIKNKLD